MTIKKEKYINFIVDDLIRKTKIDYDQERIYFPFLPTLISLSLPFFYFPASFHSAFSIFNKYIEEKYGAREEEVKVIWDMYKDRIESLIFK